jgi:hypothetical protein
MVPEDRRAPVPAFRLAGDLVVDVLVPVGAGDHLVLSGTVVELGDSTVTVAMTDGVAALTVATTNRCVLVWGEDGAESCALVRTGRRVDDVHSPTTIELVLEEVQLLADLVAGAVESVG